MGCGTSRDDATTSRERPSAGSAKAYRSSSALLFAHGLDSSTDYLLLAEDDHEGLCATIEETRDDSSELPPGVIPVSLRLAVFVQDVEDSTPPRPFLRVRLAPSPRAIQQSGVTVVLRIGEPPANRVTVAPSHALGVYWYNEGPQLVLCPVDDDNTIHSSVAVSDAGAALTVDWAVSTCGFASHDEAIIICAVPPVPRRASAELPMLWGEQDDLPPLLLAIGVAPASVPGVVPQRLQLQMTATAAATLKEELHAIEEAAAQCALRLVSVAAEWNYLGSDLHDMQRDGLDGCWVALYWGDAEPPSFASSQSLDRSQQLAPWAPPPENEPATPFDDSLGAVLASALLLAARDPLPPLPSQLSSTKAAIVALALFPPTLSGGGGGAKLPHQSVMFFRTSSDDSAPLSREILVADAEGTSVSFLPVRDIVFGDGHPDLLRRVSFRPKALPAAVQRSGSVGGSVGTPLNRRRSSFIAASKLNICTCAFDGELHLAPLSGSNFPKNAVAELQAEASPGTLYRGAPRISFAPAGLPRFAAGIAQLVDPATSRVLRAKLRSPSTSHLVEFDLYLLVFGHRAKRHPAALIRLVPVGGGGEAAVGEHHDHQDPLVSYAAVIDGKLTVVDGITALQSLLHRTYAEVLRFKWDITPAVHEAHVTLQPKCVTGMALRWDANDKSLSVGPRVYDAQREAFLLHPTPPPAQHQQR